MHALTRPTINWKESKFILDIGIIIRILFFDLIGGNDDNLVEKILVGRVDFDDNIGT
jgi:hypothetical protein